MEAPDLLAVDRVVERLQKALDRSVADQAEIVWFERRRAEARSWRRPEAAARRQLTVEVRVSEAGRAGFYRTAFGAAGELEDALRQAVAHSRAQPRVALPRELPGADDAGPAAGAGLSDREVAELTSRRARDLLAGLGRRGERARLGWALGNLVVANSHGLVRSAELTAVELAVRSGRGAGVGSARGASRSLAGLGAGLIFERARARAGGEPDGDGGAPGRSLVLAAEVVTELVALLGRVALTSEAFGSGRSFLRRHLGARALSGAVTLRDDGTDPAGLPLPFDFEGRAKGPVELIAAGVVRTPAVDAELAAELGLPRTPHFLAPGESAATHLFLAPGETTDDGLLTAADDGVWVGRIGRLVCFDPGAGRFQARLAEARRIAGGRRGPPLRPRLWQDRLERVFSQVLAVGSEAVCCPLGDPLTGGVAAPAMAVEAAGGGGEP